MASSSDDPAIHVLVVPSWYPKNRSDLFGNFFREQALAMQASGCRVGVIATRLVSVAQPFQSFAVAGRTRFELDEAMPTYRLAALNLTPRLWQANARRIGRTGWHLYQDYVENHGRPDLIHVQSSLMAGAIARIILKRDGIPFVVSEHSSGFLRNSIPKKGLSLARDVFNQAAGAFAVSSSLCRRLEKILDFPPGKFELMPNMVQMSYLDEPLQEEKNDPSIKFLHVSTLDKNKDVENIIRAFGRFCKDNPTSSLVIGGDGPERSALVALTTSLGVRDKVRFTGWMTRDQVREEMGRAAAFLLSSHHETFSIVLIEAMAMGLPSVATRCGGPEDIVTPETGIMVPPGDVEAFAGAMRKVVETRDGYDPQKLRAHCRAKYGPETISARWLEIYRGVIDNAAGAR
ncbi:MAG: glycosyltransferase [Rhizobiaceae bacterium]|nr:glycosyltransferase [Rhizobiaceae bacterium]